MILEYK